MKRRRFILLGGLLLAGVLILLLWPRGPKEPVFEGKRLSQWLAGTLPGQRAEEGNAAEKAVEAIGTNALPWLMTEFTQRDPKWRSAARTWLAKWPWTSGRVRTEEDRILMAANGLYILGPRNAAMLPALTGYLGYEQRGLLAAQAISAAGELALPYLLTALTSSNEYVAFAAVSCLGMTAEKTEAAILPLIQLLQHTNESMRSFATLWMSNARSRPDLAVPALSKASSDPYPMVRRNAASSLRVFGTNAEPAVPDLLRLMEDTNSNVREMATNAIRIINPAALPGHKTPP
jgi:vesicle coat complex subunit